MNTSLFYNAQFGDKFRTRGGENAIYIAYLRNSGSILHTHYLWIEGSIDLINVDDDGLFIDKDCHSDKDILSRVETPKAPNDCPTLTPEDNQELTRHQVCHIAEQYSIHHPELGIKKAFAYAETFCKAQQQYIQDGHL